MAVRAGLKLNEYGLFDAVSGDLIAAETEEVVYRHLGLPYIEPTLREDRGEVEAALAGELPDVITLAKIRGDLHTHTDLTDGLAPLERMLEAGAAKGYAYYAVTDHAPNLAMQRMTDEKMLAQREQVERLRARFPTMTLLHGTELNIDPGGGVDWDERFLAGFDITVASVHSHFGQSRDDMTRRVIRAMENPYVNVIGHLTTRKIGRRDPVDLDLDGVFAAAARTGTALEINAYPDRLDLRDEHVFRARRHGVRFAIDTDSHAVGHLDAMLYGVGVAQRGWLTAADDVINAWPLGKATRFLREGSLNDLRAAPVLLRGERHRDPRRRCSVASSSGGWPTAPCSVLASSRPRCTDPTIRRATRTAAEPGRTAPCSDHPGDCTCTSRTACIGA